MTEKKYPDEMIQAIKREDFFSVFPLALFEKNPIQTTDFIDLTRLKELLDTKAVWLNRNEVEDNDEYVHFIPYTAITTTCPDGQQGFFTYQRLKGIGEEKLLGNISVGVGGHISQKDILESEFADKLDSCFSAMVVTQILEVQEELNFKPADGYDFEALGIMYDDSNKVGRYHIAYLATLSVPYEEAVAITTNESFLKSLGIMTKAGIEAYEQESGFVCENWTKIMLDKIAN